jgi:hypothetical protein
MVCQICGKNSGFYPICIDCNKLKEEGKVTKCESCGKWKKDSKPLCYDCWLESKNINKNVKALSTNKMQKKYTDQNFREKH